MATDPGVAARRAAQRRLAKQIHEGTYQRSNIGAKAREVANRIKQEDEAYELNSARDAAYWNQMGKLGNYVKFYEPTVEANVYGGTTRESGPVPGMTLTQARWTANADAEELRSQATPYYIGNPWWYH
jgi:hypothetical protein